MKNYLQKNVTEFLAQQLCILEVDSLNSLAGLLNEISLYRFVSLLSVPRAAALAAQQLHDFDKVVNRVVTFLLKINHKKHFLKKSVLGRTRKLFPFELSAV